MNGQVAALLELGSGFHPSLTGRENVRLNAALLGLSRRQTAAAFERIVEFSGIREFIDEPLRTYSTGMMMRLAFSVAINRDPEILLVDEVLAVGDAAFQAKCIEKIHEFRNAGKTLLCVSHTSMIQQLCDRAIWLDHGELILSGPVADVLEAYAGRQTASRVMRGNLAGNTTQLRRAIAELQELLRRSDSPPSRQELAGAHRVPGRGPGADRSRREAGGPALRRIGAAAA